MQRLSVGLGLSLITLLTALPLPAAAENVAAGATANRAFSFRPEPLRAAVQHLIATFGPRYPGGPEYLTRLDALERRRAAALERWRTGKSDAANLLAALSHDIDALERDALLSNPLLDFDRLLLVKRAYRIPPLRPSVPPVNRGRSPDQAKDGGSRSLAVQRPKEPGGKPRSPKAHDWSYNEALEGNALGLPVNHNSIFSIRRTGYANELAVLSPVGPQGRLTTLFQPPDGLFVGEVDLDFDARSMLVTMPEDDRWQVFELRADGTGLRRITPNDEPDVDNYDACYLPDGRIVFCSTASYQSIPCWNGLHNTASLYLLDRRSGDVRQLTFDQDDDNYPGVLHDGRILFTRWEYANIPHFFGRLLFSMNPDGTAQREYYGSNSYWPNAMYFARAVPGHASKVVAIVSGHHGDFRMGNLAIFDPALGRRQHQGLVFRLPGDWHQHVDMLNRFPEGTPQPVGYDKQREPIVRDRLTSHDWPKFLHPYPLDEHFILVSAKPSPQSNWGIYLVDTFGNMTLVHEAPGQALLEPVPLRATAKPPVIHDRVDLACRDGTVYLSDVYAGPGLAGVPRGEVKRLRVLAYDFGYRGLAGFDKVAIDGAWDVMRIIGTVPVEADGSAAFHVPANTPIAVQPLDERNRAVQLMRSWFTVMPGEVKSCVGCHESQNDSPPARHVQAMFAPPRAIEPWYGPPRGFSFEREVQPVLDRYCVDCHDGRETVVAGRPKPDLRPRALRPDYEGILANVPQWYDPANVLTRYDGELQRIGQRKHIPIKFTPAYEALIKYVRRTGPEGDYHLLEPGEYHADTSLFVQLLEQGHYGVELDREAWDRLVTWIDLNVPCHGRWSEALPIPFDGARRKRELARKYAALDYDPEAPTSAPPPVEPVTPRKVQVTVGDTAALAWPFDGYEARRRQEAAGPQTERTLRVADGLELKLALIPAGEFIMGNAADGSPAEWPQTRVRIERPFWMAACEVTNAQYAHFDPAHDSRFERAQKMNVHMRGYPMNEPEQPVVRVAWQEALGFCRWLAERTGEPFTLPTEAQWEYACRAGSAQAMWWGGFDENFAERANLADRTIKGLTKWDASPLNQIYDGWMPLVEWVDDGAMVTSAPGRYVPNPWGLFDMHGNAAEWTASLDRPYPYDAPDGRDDPTAPGPRIARGGSWCDLPQFATASYRAAYPPWRKIHNVGFRVICLAEIAE